MDGCRLMSKQSNLKMELCLIARKPTNNRLANTSSKHLVHFIELCEAHAIFVYTVGHSKCLLVQEQGERPKDEAVPDSSKADQPKASSSLDFFQTAGCRFSQTYLWLKAFELLQKSMILHLAFLIVIEFFPFQANSHHNQEIIFIFIEPSMIFAQVPGKDAEDILDG